MQNNPPRVVYRRTSLSLTNPTITAHLINEMIMLCLVNNNDNKKNSICSAKMGNVCLIISEVVINHKILLFDLSCIRSIVVPFWSLWLL